MGRTVAKRDIKLHRWVTMLFVCELRKTKRFLQRNSLFMTPQAPAKSK